MSNFGICGCDQPAVRFYKSQPICATCLGIETSPYFHKIIENDWAHKEVKRDHELQSRRRYNMTRKDRVKPPAVPPEAPKDAMLTLAGAALYWWAAGKWQRAI